MNDLTPTHADYSALGIPQETAARLEDCASRIEAGAKLTGEGILQIGAALNEARAEFGDNDRAFGQWRKARLPWLEPDTALNFQRVAERFSIDPRKISAVSRMSRSVLYALAAPSTPDTVVDQAMDLAETGERVTLATVRELIGPVAAPPTAQAPRRHAPTVQRASQRLGDELRRFTGDLASLPASSTDDRAPLSEIAQWLEAALGAVRGRLWTIDERASPSAPTAHESPADTPTPPAEPARQDAPSASEERLADLPADRADLPADRRALAEIGHQWRQEGMAMGAIAETFNAHGWTPNRIGKPGAAPRADSAKEWTLKAVSQLLMRDY